jgi:hypothetical protein
LPASIVIWIWAGRFTTLPDRSPINLPSLQLLPVKLPFRFLAATLAVASLAVVSRDALAQSLRGSHASVSLMHSRAIRGGLDFYETSGEVRRAVLRGELVALRGNANYTVHNVRTPYVRPATRSFVAELAVGYRRACREPLVVTSATRPMSRKLANGSALSVHPTGMAIDLRRPSGRCLTWLRKTLLAAERRGEIEATEERRPPHFHVAVLRNRVQKASVTASQRSANTRSRSAR